MIHSGSNPVLLCLLLADLSVMQSNPWVLGGVAPLVDLHLSYLSSHDVNLWAHDILSCINFRLSKS